MKTAAYFLLYSSMIVSALTSCAAKRARVGSSLMTVQTSSALAAACKNYSDADAPKDAEAQKSELCACLQSRPGTAAETSALARACTKSGDVTKNANAIYNLYKSRWPADFLALDPSHNAVCLERLTQSALELYYFELTNLCKRTDLPSLLPFTTYKAPTATNNSCWQLTGMTNDGCFEAEPCVGTKADLKYLPLAPPRSGLTSDKVTLCNTAIQNIHHIKDPNNTTYLYNNPFAIELCRGDMRNPGNYAAPNCHGTAQAIIGEPLRSLEMKQVQYRALADKNICNDLAERTLASEHPATVASLALKPGGLLINMNHSPTCSPTDCGTSSLYVDSCTATELQAFTFVNQLCIQCWSRLVQNAGLKALDTSSTPADLKPGCFLTQADHSVVTVLQSQNLCYFYEATSPYGPPQLRVKPCAALWNLFELKWCPDQPMGFSAH